jgi:hypothetical protein
MHVLATIGAAGATPLVLQFLLDYIYGPGNATQVSFRAKINLSILVGIVLSFLLALKTLTFPTDPTGILFLAIDGGFQGVLATGAVSLGLKIADRIGSGPEERPLLVTGVELAPAPEFEQAPVSSEERP